MTRRSMWLVVFADGERIRANTLEAVPAVLKGAGGRLATVIELGRLTP